jgi:hypothetical protein
MTREKALSIKGRGVYAARPDIFALCDAYVALLNERDKAVAEEREALQAVVIAICDDPHKDCVTSAWYREVGRAIDTAIRARGKR